MRFVFGDCTLDTERYELRRAGQVIALEPRAFRVLAYLLRHTGRAVAKQELLQACWPAPSPEAISQEYALRNCLMKIRQMIGNTGTPQAVIETVRGYGYRVAVVVTVLASEALASDIVSPDYINVPALPVPSGSSLAGLQEWAAPDTKDGPVQVSQALDTSGMQSRPEVRGARGLTPLVGREAELALLHARWAQAQDGLGQVVVLSGEPGIGKSRLVQAFHEHLVTEPHVRIEWRCTPNIQQSPLQPVIAHVHRLLHWRPEDAPETTLRTLEATLTASGLALPEVVPLLAALLALPLPAHSPPLALTPQRQRHKTMEALLTWLLAETVRQPVLFIVEDLHWSDPSTLELLSLLLDQGPIAHLLTLLTCRPEFAVPWSFRAHCTPLTLSRLTQTQVAEMIGGVAGGKALPPVVVAQIAVKTDGVPLFVEELTKMVLESGLLHEAEDAYALSGPLPPLTIPATLHDSLMTRLDRLGPVKAVAQLGATIGRMFAYDLLQAVALQDEAALQQGLRQLVEAELVYQRGIPPQATYTFKHALIQDAAYHSLLRRTRQQYHRRIAQVVEAQFADLAETQPELLAHHYNEARLAALALPYYRQAGAKAVARSAYREAVALFERALRVIQHLPDSCDTIAQAIDLRLALRTALRPLGEFGRTLVVLREAENLAAALSDTRRLGQVAVYLAVQFRMMGVYDQAEAAAQRALVVATANDDVVLHALAQQYLGIICQDQGDYDRAIACLEQTITALAGAHQHDLCGVDLLPAVLSRAALASCHAERGTFAAGRAVGEAGLCIAEAVAHPSSLMFAIWGLGLLALRQGDLPRALPWLERAVDSCQEADVSGYFPRIAATLGAAYTLAGRLADAVPLLTQAWEQTMALDMRGLQTLCGHALGEAQMQAGRLEEAHALAEHTLELTSAHQERGRQAYALHLLGDIAARREPPEVELAETFYQQALTMGEALGMRPLQAHCHHGLGILYATGRQAAQACAELSTAIALYRALDMTFWLPQAEAMLAQVVETRCPGRISLHWNA
jgi:DNA-binding winged helix-turn-helix (wHTH) protein/tetratricopeptide (TPR) repeat protein